MSNVMSKYIHMNGKLVPFDEAKVHVLSVGITYASTVFEGLRGYWNEAEQQVYVFRLDAHCRRLMESMKLLRMEHRFTEEDLAASVLGLVRANELREDAHIRQLAFVEGIGPIGTSGPVGLAVTATPSYRLFDSEKGVACAISSWRRISDDCLPPRIKCVANYQNGRHAFVQAKLDGYDSVIMLNSRGKVAEGPTMCVFLVRHGQVVTPAISSDVLESITRATVIQLFEEYHGIEVVEREVDRTEFYVADEAFFCGTACEVLPITSVDRHPVGDGRVGALTGQIQTTYNSIVRGVVPDHAEWRTGVYRG